MKAKYIGVFFTGLFIGVASAFVFWFCLSWIFHSAYPDPQRGCVGFSMAYPIDWKASNSSKTLTLIIHSESDARIEIEQVNVSTDYKKPCANRININRDLMFGENYTVYIENCSLPATGEFYSADVTIVYTNLDSKIQHLSEGQCYARVEK